MRKTKVNKNLKKKDKEKNNKKEDIRANNIEEQEYRTVKKPINKVKIIFVSLILLAIFAYVFYVIISIVNKSTEVFVVTNGEVAQEESVNGYIVREETVVRGENYKNGMVKIKNEGERVAKGDSIFRYYSSGEESIKTQIASLNSEIQTIMENETGALKSDIKLLESQIEKELDTMYGENSVQKIKENKKTIVENITKKATIVGDNSPEGSNLKKLIKEKASLEEQLNENSEYVSAPESGTVSYRIDGLEDVLTTEKFGEFNKEFLEKLNLKTGQTISSSEEMGKIINNYQCYLVFNTSSEDAKSAQISDKITIRLQNSDEIQAEIVNIIEESDNSRTITIKIEKDVEELIDYRKISFDIIWWSAKGYRIPNSAIKEINGLNYVVRNRNGYYNKMLVKILKQNDEYCIVKQYTTEELKELGFTNSEIYSMKNINLYDEIVINPTEEQLLQ